MRSVTALPGTYKIKEFLGEGLNSCVYRAFKESDHLGVRFDVALKILKSENMVSLWRNEFERLSKIGSEHCVKLLGWEILPTGPALVLEYVKGLNLIELQQHAHLTTEDLCEIIDQARAGLEHLAKQNLFHGDLSPQNIMIDVRGRVKLVDFGISIERKRAFVTPKYASPEIIMGEHPTLETDLLSLALIEAEIQQRAKTNNEGGDISLAQKVRLALAERRRTYSQTQPLRLLPPQTVIHPRPVRKYIRNAIVPILFLFSILSRGDAHLSANLATGVATSQRLARLIVRSPGWLAVRLEDRDLGFAPVDAMIKPGDDFRLQWRSAEKSGEIKISLKPGETFRILR